MQSYCLHKAPVNYRNSPDFLQYMRWEERQYPQSKYPSLPSAHVPDEKKIANYHRVSDHLRRRMREADRIKDEDARQARHDFLYRLLDANMGRIFHERSPSLWPDIEPVRHHAHQFRKKEGRVVRFLPGIGSIPMPKAEHIFTGTDAHPV